MPPYPRPAREARDQRSPRAIVVRHRGCGGSDRGPRSGAVL